jgi:hypothetical protein
MAAAGTLRMVVLVAVLAGCGGCRDVLRLFGELMFGGSAEELCAVARRTKAEADLRACWDSAAGDVWRPSVLHIIANNDLVGMFDLVEEAVNGSDLELAREGANALLYLAQSPDATVREQVQALQETVIRPRLEALASDSSRDGVQVRALLGLTLVYLKDAAGVEPSVTFAADLGYSAYTPGLLARLVARYPAFFEALMALADGASEEVLEHVAEILELVDWSVAEWSVAERARARTVELLRRILEADPAESLRTACLLTWVHTGDDAVLEPLAEYLGAEAARPRQDEFLAAVDTIMGTDGLTDLRERLPDACPAREALDSRLQGRPASSSAEPHAADAAP